MADQKISQLTTIVTVDTASDLFPIVDTSAAETKKITPSALKTALSLNNVDNTSDANKPISSATQTALDAKQATLVSGTNIKTVNNTSLLGSGNITIAGGGGTWGSITGTLSSQSDLQTALDGKVDENTPITGATKTKITYDAKGLVTAGADATTADIADSTNRRYVTDAQLVVVGNTSGTNTGDNAVNSLYSGLATSKQDTLVSGTNIKTLNSTSLLGSGNIVLTANPSGVAGAIQFSNGSAFASDASNLFWDDTNNRLGIGTNAPSTTLNVVGQTTFSDNALFSTDFKSIGRDLNNSSIRFASVSSEIRANISTGGQFHVYNAGSGTSRFGVSSGGQTTISGGGSTSATTSLLVQNSAGTELFRVRDDQQTIMRGTVTVLGIFNNDYISIGLNRIYGMSIGQGALTFNANNISYSDTGSVAGVTSSCFNIDSTTRGFLPPRMTTTQKNAIATPAAGLVVYDSTTNKLCCYNGSTWNDLF